MSNLIFRTLLSGLSWEIIIRVLGLRERVKGIGDGEADGYRYTVVQRGDEILIVLSDYAPREKCQEVAKKILSHLSPESKIQVATMGYASSNCNFCLKPSPMPYHCHRCGGWYCESHRLPEKHNCPDEGEKTGKIAEQLKPRKHERKREIIVAEVPCG